MSRDTTHQCPAPPCTRRVARHLFACPQDWRRLPVNLKAAIQRTVHRDVAEHAHAMADAVRWYQANQTVAGGGEGARGVSVPPRAGALASGGHQPTCCESHVPDPPADQVGPDAPYPYPAPWLGKDRVISACCDPDDCGPCCPSCPTCPTEVALRAVDLAAADALADHLAAVQEGYDRQLGYAEEER